jgi:ATP-dependent Clp protease protease subunit
MNELMWGDQESINLEKSVKDSSLYRSYNEIWFNCSVTNETINKAIKLMYEIVHDEKLSAYRESSKEIEIIFHIDSPGGSVKSMLKFIDFVMLLKKKNVKLKTIINGYAASAATLMAIIGDEREITPHSHAMIHELSSLYHGNYTHLQSYSKHLDFLHTQIINIYKTHIRPTQPAADPKKKEPAPPLDLEKMLLKETWMDANEYLKLGFVDRICS